MFRSAKEGGHNPQLIILYCFKKSICSQVIRQVLEKWYQNVYVTQFSWVDSHGMNKSWRMRRVERVPMCNQILMGKVLRWKQHLKDLNGWKDNIKVDLGGNCSCVLNWHKIKSTAVVHMLFLTAGYTDMSDMAKSCKGLLIHYINISKH